MFPTVSLLSAASAESLAIYFQDTGAGTQLLQPCSGSERINLRPNLCGAITNLTPSWMYDPVGFHFSSVVVLVMF